MTTTDTIVAAVPCPDPALFAQLRRFEAAATTAAALDVEADRQDQLARSMPERNRRAHERHADDLRARAAEERQFAATYEMPPELIEWQKGAPSGTRGT